MAGDMYLENLEEFVFDEDKVVTYRWLSQTLSVHVNRAKQMLATFVEQTKPKAVNVTYLLSGIEEKENGVKVNIVTLVSDDNLKKSEASLSKVLSKHVYSVQQAKLKDTNSLYMTDYEIIKENITQPNRYSAIKCTEAKQRTPEELAELSGNDHASAPNTPPARPKMNGNAEKHIIENLKPEPQKSLASKPKKGQGQLSFKAFSGTSGKGSSEKSEEKTKEVIATQKQETSKKQGPSSKAKGGMMAFLNKPSTKKVKKEEESTPPKEPVSSEPVPSEPVVQTSQKKKDAGVKSKRKATKSNISDSDSEDDTTNKQSSKRRRRIIQQDSSSSESEEELSDMEEDSPIPPTPPPPAMETNDSDDGEEEEGTVVPERSSHGTSAQPSSGKKRRRKRVLKKKITIDDDGCMVTDKVWESESTDASEDEAPPAKTTPSSLPSQPSPKEGGAPKTDGGEDEGKKKTSPGSGSGSGKAKQRSLMSFFKKK
ncbi:DNA polymerase delta subunit 3-like [Asterias rubens]|uniref:DNA polymerase delta subunit 3-like n=1 Tax=Asterias rubens TaxID=7604 RepID=UPI0014553F90|nr:DNA polymerase delta subunit 3-like [Asterias rubens]